MTCKPYKHELFAAGKGSELFIGAEKLGYLGECSKPGLAKFELRGQVSVAELRIDVLEKLADLIPQAVELSPYPPVARDINLVVDEAIRWADVEQTVLASAGPLLEELSYRDTWRDPQKLGAGKKSLLFSLQLRGKDDTLTSATADQVRDSVLSACAKNHGGVLRA